MELSNHYKADCERLIQITVNNPSERPEHVNVEFLVDGEVMKGIVTDAKVLDVIDELFHYLKYVKA